MELFSWPIWKYQKTHKKADTTAYGNGEEAIMSDFHDIVNTIAWHSYQIEGQ